MKDVIIIGAGPAGSTLARLIGSHFDTLLIEKRDLTGNSNHINKSCGGLIAPDAQQALAYLGIGIPHEVLVGPQVFTVRTIDFDNNVERYYQRHYINIDRKKFDQYLVKLIPGQVLIHDNACFKNLKIQNDCVEVEYIKNKETIHEKARIIIGADGANSIIRKKLDHNKNINNYFSIQETFLINENFPYFTVIFDKSITDYYSWIIPKNNKILVGSALKLGNNISDKYDLLIQKLRKYGFKMHDGSSKAGAFIRRPKSYNDIFIGISNIGLAGEAAGFISPSSGEGLSYAFKTAIILADCLIKYKTKFLTHYRKELYFLENNILLKNIKSLGMYNTFFRKVIMKSGLASMKVYN